MPSTTIRKPAVGEYAPPFGKYIDQVPETGLAALLESQLNELAALIGGLTDEQALAVHPPYTWTIKQVLGHLLDCERVFGYRILRLARGDRTPLPGFDENAFMAAANFNAIPLAELLAEFTAVRESHIRLLRHLPADAWSRQGTVSEHPMTTRAMAYALAGHAGHHLGIMVDRLAVR